MPSFTRYLVLRTILVWGPFRVVSSSMVALPGRDIVFFHTQVITQVASFFFYFFSNHATMHEGEAGQLSVQWKAYHYW